jgi:hypothetical protein
MRRLLALGLAAGVAAIVALPGALPAIAQPAQPAAAAGRSAASVTASTTTAPTPTSSSPSPSSAPSSTPTPTPTPTPTKKPKPKPKPRKLPPNTWLGPHMYNPNSPAGGNFSYASTVTVTQTTNLVNQMVLVSWTGFTPSDSDVYDADSVDYPVMIAECHGLHPTDPDQCFDATNNGNTSEFGANGPSNTTFATTSANGDGRAYLQLLTTVQNQFLGCDQNHPCSLVVVPAQGGNSLEDTPPDCSDHSVDIGGTATGAYSFVPLPQSLCSWEKRVVVPLYFAPTAGGCPLRTADFTAGGSPMLQYAMSQWQTALCGSATSPVNIQYNSEINESEARNDFLSGIDDVAFTTQPATGTGVHPYTYAPVAVSAVSLAYWIDSSVTGQPFTNLKMNARLLLKLLTTSYQFTGEGCPQAASYPFGCDNGVDGNPVSLYTDPEFIKLNRQVAAQAANNVGYQIPTVVSGDSDMTWTTTSWIASDKDASAFLAGQFDNWGMHVNTYYLGLQYPTDAFLPMDPYFPLAQQYNPTYPLASIATYQAQNWEPGDGDVKDPTTGNYTALSPQTPGNRSLFALTDEGAAANFLFPVAAMENAAGKFVEPTQASMAAAVKDMTVNPDGITRSMNFADKDPAAYPLTMVIYAMVPTGGVSAAKAAKIAQFLDYVADQGQVTGSGTGDLAPGYLPLPQDLRQQTLKAAYAVLDQTGNPKPAATQSASASPSASPSATARASSPPPAATPSATSAARAIALSFSNPDSVGMSWVVLALLISGLAFLLGGPTTLLYASPGARTAIRNVLRRVRHVKAPAGPHALLAPMRRLLIRRRKY